MMKHHDQFTEAASQFCRFLLLTADKLCDRRGRGYDRAVAAKHLAV
ncbi:MAG: hypothetical protein SOW01_06635 [Mediterranea sp.]|nr:hypothetical protein [Mediterranea sp.]